MRVNIMISGKRRRTSFNLSGCVYITVTLISAQRYIKSIGGVIKVKLGRQNHRRMADINMAGNLFHHFMLALNRGNTVRSYLTSILIFMPQLVSGRRHYVVGSSVRLSVCPFVRPSVRIFSVGAFRQSRLHSYIFSSGERGTS